MEYNTKKLRIRDFSNEQNLINYNRKNISPNILQKKYIKYFFISKNLFNHNKTNTNISLSKLIKNKPDNFTKRKTYEKNNKINCIKEYKNQENQKIINQPKKRIKYKVIRNISPKEKEKRLTSPLRNNNNSINKIVKAETSINKSKIKKNLILKINLQKSNKNPKNKKLIFFPNNKIYFSLDNILSKKNINQKKTKTKTNSLDNKRVIINNTPRIKLKYMENKLNTEKIKRNKKLFMQQKKQEKPAKIIFNRKKKKEQKNSSNAYNSNIKNVKTKIFNSKDNSNNNSKLISDNISTNYKSLNSKNYFNSSKKKKESKNMTPDINMRKKNNKRNKINSCKNTEREISYKLFEFGLENEKNEKINGVKINNFDVNKPKEENLKFTFTKEEKDSELSVSCASKVIIGKIDGYKDIIETDKKNNNEHFICNTNILKKKFDFNSVKNIKINKKIINDDNDSITFNEDEFSDNINLEDLLSSTNTNNKINGNIIEKNNYDYNKDSYYLRISEKFENNKNNKRNFDIMSFSINSEKDNKVITKKDNLNIIKVDNKEKKKTQNSDNCFVF